MREIHDLLFEKATEGMTAEEVLNYYRNLYHGKPQSTEHGIVANALNDILSRMILPPCKVGDIVYAVSLNTETNIVAVHRGYIGSIDISSSGNYIFIFHEGFDDEPYFKNICGKFEDFGKTVFLTREEAEQALKGEQHGKVY